MRRALRAKATHKSHCVSRSHRRAPLRISPAPARRTTGAGPSSAQASTRNRPTSSLKLTKADGPQEAYHLLGEVGVNANTLIQAKNAMGPQAWTEFAAAKIRSLGRAVPEEPFDAKDFAAAWDAQGHTFKGLLPREHRAAIEAVVKSEALDGLQERLGGIQVAQWFGNPKQAPIVAQWAKAQESGSEKAIEQAEKRLVKIAARSDGIRGDRLTPTGNEWNDAVQGQRMPGLERPEPLTPKPPADQYPLPSGGTGYITNLLKAVNPISSAEAAAYKPLKGVPEGSGLGAEIDKQAGGGGMGQGTAPPVVGFKPSQMRKLLKEEDEQLVGMWHEVRAPLGNASDFYKGVVSKMKKELEVAGVLRAKSEAEVRQILLDRTLRGERPRATRPEQIDQ